jgi:hypothetical protein
MKHPGFYRAVPGAILGFVIGELIVVGLRSMQGLSPWDPGVAIVLAPFTMMAGWMWGLGALNPKLSQHGEHHDEHAIVEAEAAEAHRAEEGSPAGMFFTEVWKSATLPLLLLLIVFAFANIPGGFGIQIANDPEANAAVFSNAVTLQLPFIADPVQTTQMAIFLVFVGWLIFSLIAFAGVFGFLMYKGHEQIAIVTQTEPTPEQLSPPPPVRAIGRAAKHLAQNLRKNLPKILGQR